MAASVFALHGAMIMPSVRNDPLEIDAPMSPGAYVTVRQRLDLLARVRRLVQQRARAPAADHEMRLDACLAQPLEQADAVDRAGRAGDADDAGVNGRRSPVSRVWPVYSGCQSHEYHRPACSSVSERAPSSARRAACSSASTTTAATTAAGAIPGCGASRRRCARSAATSASCRSSSAPASSSTC